MKSTLFRHPKSKSPRAFVPILVGNKRTRGFWIWMSKKGTFHFLLHCTIFANGVKFHTLLFHKLLIPPYYNWNPISVIHILKAYYLNFSVVKFKKNPRYKKVRILCILSKIRDFWYISTVSYMFHNSSHNFNNCSLTKLPDGSFWSSILCDDSEL